MLPPFSDKIWATHPYSSLFISWCFKCSMRWKACFIQVSRENNKRAVSWLLGGKSENRKIYEKFSNNNISNKKVIATKVQKTGPTDSTSLWSDRYIPVGTGPYRRSHMRGGQWKERRMHSHSLLLALTNRARAHGCARTRASSFLLLLSFALQGYVISFALALHSGLVRTENFA